MITEKLYDHKKCEQEAQSLWESEKIYHFTANPQKEVFSIDTPPPTVSGTLHIGHIFSYTHADVIARYKRMKGYNVFYPMGFDDNGLPTERYVEKKNSTKAHLMKRSEFINLCLKETHDVEKLFENLWRSMALSIDWNKVYSTISPKVQRISQYSFIELYQKGHVYRKEEPSLYCTTCRTSVSQAELDSAELSSHFNDIAFRSEDGEPFIIATTRPELLPACVAVFFHPEDPRYKHLAGKFLITPIFEQSVMMIADDKVDPEKGTGLVMCCTYGDQTDIFWQKKHKLPVIQAIGLDGKWSDKTGPLAGLTAHEARKKVLELLKESGALRLQKAITHNVNVHERCKQEIEYTTLTQWFINILDHKEKFLELADQIVWKPEFMKARYRDWVTNLSWDWCISRQRFFGIPFPAWHCADCKEVILADPKDLPIDPQETAYPGKACPKCKSVNVTPDTDVMDTWNTSALTPQINVGWPDNTGAHALRDEPNGSPQDERGDTGARGEEPEGRLEPSLGQVTIPMSMRPQAHDIIRTWAFDTIVKAYFHHNDIPWKNIVMSGHVLAGKEKISKSKENSKMAPEVLLQEFPADAVRFWASNGKLGTDTVFSENELKIGLKLITKLWNAFKFCSEHLEGYDPSRRSEAAPRGDGDRSQSELNQAADSTSRHHENQATDSISRRPEEITSPHHENQATDSISRRPEEMSQTSSRGTSHVDLDDLNKWLLHELSSTYTTYQKHFDQFDYHAALEIAEKFFWNTFCDNYLELVKDQFFNPDKYSAQTIEGSRFTLYQTGFAILQMYAPFIPHITETLYQQLYKKTEQQSSLHITTFDRDRYTYNYHDSATLIHAVLNVVAGVRKLKSEKQVSLKTELQNLVIHVSDAGLANQLKTQEALIGGITKALKIELVTQALEQNVLEDQNGVLVAHVKI